MSTFLLDTHSFLWTLFDSKCLSKNARELITDANNHVVISTISFWEISLKASLGKLRLEGCKPEILPEMAVRMELEVVTLQPEHAASFYQLPKLAHKDPFDRMLVWQAIQNQWIFISKDKQLPAYQAHGLRLFW